MTYHEWLLSKVCFQPNEQNDYQQLLDYLDERIFTWTIDRDENRAFDGIALRRQYERETNEQCERLNNWCSVLEMMVALAVRCEESIMYDPELPCRTNEWFWSMICSLGLYFDDDWHYSVRHARAAVDRFLDRTYEPDGYGGPFYVEGCSVDMRKEEIWYQLNYWLEQNYYEC